MKQEGVLLAMLGRSLPVFFVVLGLVIAFKLFPYIEQQFNRPIAKVMVLGNLNYLDKAELISNVDVYANDKLFDISLGLIQHKLEKMPWVYSVQVERRWPDLIKIFVVEQKPITHWNDSELLNQYGENFDRQEKIVRGLPYLSGREGNEMHVMERYLEFSELMALLGMRISELDYDEQGSWMVVLDEKINLKLGSDDVLEKMRRFVFLYQQDLQYAGRAVEVVDLRYGDGAAVRWGKDELLSAKTVALRN